MQHHANDDAVVMTIDGLEVVLYNSRSDNSFQLVQYMGCVVMSGIQVKQIQIMLRN